MRFKKKKASSRRTFFSSFPALPWEEVLEVSRQLRLKADSSQQWITSAKFRIITASAVGREHDMGQRRPSYLARHWCPIPLSFKPGLPQAWLKGWENDLRRGYQLFTNSEIVKDAQFQAQ